MRYKVYHQGEVLGPLEAEALKTHSWFHEGTLVCPETASGLSANDWKKAGEIHELFRKKEEESASYKATTPKAAALRADDLEAKLEILARRQEALEAKIEKTPDRLEELLAAKTGRVEKMVEESAGRLTAALKSLGEEYRQFQEATHARLDELAKTPAGAVPQQDNLQEIKEAVENAKHAMQESQKSLLEGVEARLARLEGEARPLAARLEEMKGLISDIQKKMEGLSQKITAAPAAKMEKPKIEPFVVLSPAKDMPKTSLGPAVPTTQSFGGRWPAGGGTPAVPVRQQEKPPAALKPAAADKWPPSALEEAPASNRILPLSLAIAASAAFALGGWWFYSSEKSKAGQSNMVESPVQSGQAQVLDQGAASGASPALQGLPLQESAGPIAGSIPPLQGISGESSPPPQGQPANPPSGPESLSMTAAPSSPAPQQSATSEGTMQGEAQAIPETKQTQAVVKSKKTTKKQTTGIKKTAKATGKIAAKIVQAPAQGALATSPITVTDTDAELVISSPAVFTLPQDGKKQPENLVDTLPGLSGASSSSQTSQAGSSMTLTPPPSKQEKDLKRNGQDKQPAPDSKEEEIFPAFSF